MAAVRRVSIVALFLASLAVFSVPNAPPASATTAIPTQWIARQHTELLGRAPTDAEMSSAITSFTTSGCTAATVRSYALGLATSSAFAGRSSGDFARHRLTISSRATGASGLTVRSRGGASFWWARIQSGRVRAGGRIGRVPVSISKSVTPSA